MLSSPKQGLGLENPACARPTASPSPGTPLPFLGNSAACSSQRLSAGQAVEHGRGARTRGCKRSPECILNCSF